MSLNKKNALSIAKKGTIAATIFDKLRFRVVVGSAIGRDDRALGALLTPPTERVLCRCPSPPISCNLITSSEPS